MKDSPGVGQARGLFELLVPGAFLWLNLMLVMYLAADERTRQFSAPLVSSTGETLAITVAFGYFIGVALRLFRSDLPDRCSARVLRLLSTTARREDGSYELWAVERFPYVEWTGKVCERSYPESAMDFYRDVWRGGTRHTDRAFLNFCKLAVGTIDKDAAGEMYAAEALTRYVSGMFYALFFASIALLCSLVFVHTGVLVVATLLGVYAVAFVAILLNYRFLRMKEVETIFCLAFCKREMLAKLFLRPTDR